MKCIISVIGILFMLLATTAGEAAETVKVAAIFGETGDASLPNTQHLQGVRLAIADLNTQGGLLHTQVELLEFDNQSTALGAKLAAEKAVEAGAIAVIGPSWSSHALGAAPVLQAAEIPMIATTATNPKVTLVGDYIFRVCFIDPFQGSVIADFAIQDLNAKTAVVLTSTGDEFSLGLAQFFVERFQQQGGRILWEGDYLPEATDFHPLLEKAIALQPDVVYLPGHIRDSGFIIKQARKMGLLVPFLGSDAWNEDMYAYGGDAIEGNYYSDHWHESAPNAVSQEYVKRYKQTYTFNEITYFTLSHDAVFLLADAVQRANSLVPRQIRDALAATRNFQGVTGSLSINNNGDPVKSAVIFKFEDETTVYVKTIEP